MCENVISTPNVVLKITRRDRDCAVRVDLTDFCEELHMTRRWKLGTPGASHKRKGQPFVLMSARRTSHPR
jgi:hypothetical protein